MTRVAGDSARPTCEPFGTINYSDRSIAADGRSRQSAAMNSRFSTLKARELVATYGFQAVDLATLESAQAITRGDLLLARRWADTLSAVEELLAVQARKAGRLN